MIAHDVEQGTPEWLRLRLGIPTASNFHKILTPATGKPSAQAAAYMHRLAAEWALGEPIDGVSTGLMQRGSEMEAKAADWYAFTRGVAVDAVGFVTTDDGRAGASPDRLVGTDGEIQIKCPGAPQHVAYLLGEKPTKYRLQIQGGLWVDGRDWCDWVSYHPTIENVRIRFERDDKFIELIESAVTTFCDHLDAAKEKLRALGVEPPEVATEPAPWRWDMTKEAPAPTCDANETSPEERAARLEEMRAIINEATYQ